MIRLLERSLVVALLLSCLAPSSVGCKACKEDDESEEQEERDQSRDHFWRAQIAIAGKGRVRSFIDAFDCSSDGDKERGQCGPKLVKFKEMKPATIEAVPAPGWRFDHWESLIREPDGAVAPRKGPMPDGRVYLNGFGYADTGELDMVKAVFVPSPAPGVLR